MERDSEKRADKESRKKNETRLWETKQLTLFLPSLVMDKSIHPSIQLGRQASHREPIRWCVLSKIFLVAGALLTVHRARKRREETCLEDFVILLGADWRRSWRQEGIDWKRLRLTGAAAAAATPGMRLGLVRLWRRGYHRIRVNRSGDWCLNGESRLDRGRCPTVSVTFHRMLLLLLLDSIIFVGDRTAAAAAAIAAAFVAF